MDEDEDDYASYEAVDALDLDGEAEAAGALQGLLSMCSSTEEQYVRLRLQGLSYTEVATELGVSRQAVQQALKRLQRRYEEANG